MNPTPLPEELTGDTPPAGSCTPSRPLLATQEIEAWLVARISSLLGIEASAINRNEPFTAYGLTSKDAVAISGELEDYVGVGLSPTLLYECPTVESLARYLATGEHDASFVSQPSQPTPAQTPIAIIGVGCRFPGAGSPREFWELLRNGVDAIRELPASRRELRGSNGLPKTSKEWGGFLDQIAEFDAHVFGISPREADQMDPQQRLLLEIAWEALEDAGIASTKLRGQRVGVFIGISTNDYGRLEVSRSANVDAYAATGNALSIAANRLSYYFDLRGPSLTIDTACSSSLVAVHLACQSLWNGESAMALVGGVNVILTPDNTDLFSKAGLMAADGRCKVLDASADGYVRSEGAGLVVLKPLAQALADGDSIYATIRGSAVNQDGRTSGLTAPSRQAQEALLRDAYRDADVSPARIQYVEMHGTGTALGDPIETKALGAVLNAARPNQESCAIGSVKSNLGHLEAAAGIAGLIKVALALKHRELPPTIHFDKPNPHIPFGDLSLRVQQRLEPWPTTDRTALAGVSAFGFGGTNAHVVLEEAPQTEATTSARQWQTLVVSAKTASALETACERLQKHLTGESADDLADIAYTSQVGRREFRHRRAVLCTDRETAVRGLSGSEMIRVVSGVAGERKLPVMMLFSGVGEQYEGMVSGLYRSEERFREVLDHCCVELQQYVGRDLREWLLAERKIEAGGQAIDLRRLLGRETANGTEQSELARTLYAQPAMFVVSYALSELLAEWGVRPQAMLGYSLGEYVAATIAGVLRLEDALMLVARRAQMIDEQVRPGGMLAVPLNSQESVRWLTSAGFQKDVTVAVRQGDRVTVLGGGAAELEEVERRLQAVGIVSRRVQTEHAFHTKNVEVVREQFEDLVRGVKLSEPQVPFVSNLNGEWVRAGDVQEASYWGRQMCAAVELGQGLENLLNFGDGALVEVGAGGSLSAVVRQCRGGAERAIVTTLPGRGERQSDEEHLARSVARLWVAGVDVDWDGYHARERRRRVTLPTYPFERQRYWIEVERNGHSPAALPAAQLKQLSKKPDVADWFYLPVWKETPLAESADSTAKKLNWLIFADEVGLGTQLAESLRALGQTVTTVSAGLEFSRRDPATFIIKPDSRRDYEAVLDELHALPNKIVHAWSVGQPCSPSAADAVSEDLRLGLYSLINLAQALGERAVSHDVDLAMLSSNMQAVTSDEPLRPGRATILGAVNVIPLEYERLSCVSIDVDQASLKIEQRETLVRCLLREFFAAPAASPVAYRRGLRLVQRFAVSQKAELAPKEVLRQGGVYLLTGGLGGLGLALGEYLAERVQARLVLIGRTALPPRDEWQKLLAGSDTTAETARRIRGVMAIEEKGGQVLALSGDIADRDQARQMIDKAVVHFGEISGVIHAAAVPGEGLIQMKTSEAAAAVLAPKISGTLALAEVFKNKPLDFFVLFSSVAALTGGGPGQVDYSAANAFLDAFACANNGALNRVLSINWAEWQWNAWAEHLNGFDSRIRSALKTHREELGITFREGVQAFAQALSLNHPRVIVSPVEIDKLIEQSRSFTVANLMTQLAPATASATHDRPPIATTFVAATNELERTIAGVWQSALGISSVGVDDNFFDLGGTSLVGMQIVSQLRGSLGVEIPAIALYEAPTIRTLVKLLSAGPRADISSNGNGRTKPRRQSSPSQPGVAIIGMAGRFPGARSVAELWRNLVDGTESITFFSDEELSASGVSAANLADPKYVRAGAVLEDIDAFDAGLFGYSPREAETMDPQHRLFLECAWAALEDAGYDSDRFDGSIGIFGGSNMSTYLSTICQQGGLDSFNLMQLGLGNSNDSLTTKVSYKLNLRGPSVAVQTFCSTSAVAVHMACRSVLGGECDMALGGGVRVAVPHRVGYLYEPGNIDSPDGHCRAFDSKGQGSVLGNGVALVVLKRLEDAIRDGDHVYAVIKASAINNDGSLKAGYTAPSVDAQATVIATALAEAGVDPSEIGYIEAHGTATELGDPIEITALTKAFGGRNGETPSCAIGSIKTNLGHLDRAAGVTGIIKTALALKHGLIPPSLNFSEPNPQIDFQSSPFFVNTQLRKWKSNGTPRRAGVNSLGIGGTNVHFILEQPPAQEALNGSRTWQIVPLAANSSSALDAARKNLVEYLRRNSDVDLADAAYTLQVGRRILDHKVAVVCNSITDAIRQLENNVLSLHQPAKRKPVAMLFSGTGEPYAGMVSGLYRSEETFREVLDHCCVELQRHVGCDLRESLVGGQAISSGPRYEQAALFAVSYALSQLLAEWGVRPQAMLGYGVGEYVAATVAGVFSVEDALLLITRRAELLACGDAESGRAEYEQLVGGMKLSEPRVAYVSSVSGEWVKGVQEASYWGRELCSAAVELGRGLERGLERMLEIGDAVLVEVGVGGAVGAAVWKREATAQQGATGQQEGAGERGAAGQREVVTLLPGRGERQSDEEQVARSVAQLWLAGVEVDWEGYHARERRRRVALPTYPFERQRYWIEAAHSNGHRAAGPTAGGGAATAPGSGAAGAALPAEQRKLSKKPDVADWFYLPVWKEVALASRKDDEHSDQAVWLVFADEHGVNEKIAARNAARAANTITVKAGACFAKADANTYTIDPANAADYQSLLAELVRDHKTPTKIVHLWNIDSGSVSFAQAQQRGFYSLIYLAQALSEQRVTNPVTIDVIATDLYDIDGQTRCAPEKATLLGPCKVIPQEYPNLTCRCIEITLDGETSASDETIDSLCQELTHTAFDLMISYLGKRRFVQTFEPRRFDAPETPCSQLRSGGTYLITGGLGGVGFLLAQFLAQSVQANLVLTGRSALPAEDEWEQWLLDHGEEDATSRKIRKVRTLTDLGARVLVVSADVADEERMRAVVTQVESEFGAVNGIIHAAGIVDTDAFRAIQQIDMQTCERHFRPKVDGLYVLDKIFREKEVDFCFLLSSLSAVLGGIGFVAYASANIFMDAFARKQNHDNRGRWISVNWDTWKTSDDEHREGRLKDLEKTVAEFALTPSEGLDAFQRILSAGDITHVVNSTGDLQARIDQWIRRQPLVCDRSANRGARALYARPNLQNAYVPVSNEAEQKIAAVLQRVLGIDKVGIHDNYFELGGTSLTALQVVSELQREFKTPISPVTLFECPTVSQMAKALIQPGDGQSALQLEVANRRQKRARAAQGDLAIVGMSCRFPGSRDVDEFWQNLKNGVETVSFFEDGELLNSGIDPELLRDPNYVRARPIIDDVDQFDAEFFGYSAREADFMDPQHRVLLETAWQALENAGYDSQRYRGAIGVFGGSNISTYALNVLSDRKISEQLNDLEAAIAFDRDSLTTRVSYKLNLRGPSFAVQTFCSTSLVAVHLACQSLYSGECDMALAGGVSIRVPQKIGYRFEAGGQDSPDGHTRTFDAKARGTVFGDGVGVVVLKRFEDAVADGDQVYAVIKGSAINNDGSVKVGYTAPSVEGQAAVVANALANAAVDAESISYIEAHGTATELGDPIEVAALSKAFRVNTPKNGFCAIGSVKSNMGHLDRAAGVAGLIKTTLSLKHKLIPPTLFYEQPNPQIDFPNSPFFVNTQLRRWERNGTARRAGVNSLGVGGTNVHVVLEEAPEKEATTSRRQWQTLVVSAKTAKALDAACERLQKHFIRENGEELADIAYTLQVGRREFRHRRAVVCTDGETATRGLSGAEMTRVVSGVAGERKLPVAMLFSGTGEPYAGMVSGLYRSEERFREVLDHCCVELQRHLGCDLRERLVGGHEISAGPRYEQAALFAVSYALSQLLAEWGVRPQAMLGYGVGEYVAATVAGVFSVEDALRLVMRRAELLACGDAESGRAEYEQLVGGMKLSEPRVPYVSSVSGEWVKGMQEASYWGRELCSATVELGRGLEPGLERMFEIGDAVLVEVGVDGAFGAAVREREAAAQQEATGQQEGAEERGAARQREVVTLLPGRGERQSDEEQVARSVAQLWVAGMEVDWDGYHARERRRRVALPTYPFERQRYWIEAAHSNGHGIAAAGAAAGGAGAAAAGALPADQLKQLSKKTDVADWFYLPVWKQAPLIESTGENASPASAYLVLHDASAIAETVVRDLASHGIESISVHIGPDFTKLGVNGYAIDPANREHYDLLIADLADQNRIPDQILHFWSLSNETAEAARAGNLNEILNRGFYSLLYLMQAIGERVTKPLQLTVVTSGLHRVIGDEEICSPNATISGPCTVIPLEYENARCRLIDVVLPAAGSVAMRRLPNQIVSDLLNGPAQEGIAYRGGQRWMRVFEPVKLKRPENKPSLLRHGGVYLITGGLGGIGLAVAKHLATTVKAKLILIGRSGLPARDEWPHLLASENGSRKVADKIRQVEELKSLGAEVLVVSADVTNAEQMRNAVAFATKQFGEINGVFHAAGTPAAGLIRLKTRQMAEAVLAPKVLGTMVLDELFADTPLDFMVLFSSMTSITGGGPGQADYCAANAFLDSYASAESPTERRVISVNWGEWLWDAWQEGLLSFDPMVQAFFKENRKEFGISFAEGMDALDRLLSAKFRQLVVSTQDFNGLIELSKSFTVDRILQEVLLRRASEQLHPRPSLGTSYIAPRSEAEVRMAKLWAELLRLERVGIYDNFFELGGNSLLGVNLISQLRTAMGAEIPVYALYEAPTVEAFARIVTSQNGEHSLDDRLDRGEMRRLKQQQRRDKSSAASRESCQQHA
jgi:acyl transferase domain-containing protein/acyl carrier protein